MHIISFFNAETVHANIRIFLRRQGNLQTLKEKF